MRSLFFAILFLSSIVLNAAVPTISQLEKDIADKNYKAVIKKAEQILRNDKTKGAEANEAAIYLRFALLKQGTLNSEYLKYTHFMEMQSPQPEEILEVENRAYIIFCQELGFVAQTEPMVSDIIKKYLVEENNPQQIPWQIVEQCYLFLDKNEYLQILRNNAGTSTENNRQEWLAELKYKTLATPIDTMLEFRGDLSDNINIFYPIYKQNKDLLEVYALQVLIDKNLNEIPKIIERYKTFGYKKLPKYIEEAKNILAGKPLRSPKNSYTEYFINKM
jgi:hypothetical protein